LSDTALAVLVILRYNRCVAAACLVQCTLFCITHTCVLGHHLSPAFNLLTCTNRYADTPSRCPLPTYLRESALGKCAQFNFVQESGKSNKIVQRQKLSLENVRYCLEEGSPLRWWTLHNKRTLGLLLFIPTCGAVCTSSWAPTRGDLRHFSREEKALGGQLAT